jgi:hypothetical protein
MLFNEGNRLAGMRGFLGRFVFAEPVERISDVPVGGERFLLRSMGYEGQRGGVGEETVSLRWRLERQSRKRGRSVTFIMTRTSDGGWCFAPVRRVLLR